MANHNSTKKRIRSSKTRNLRNKYQHKTTRTFISRLRKTTDKEKGLTLLKQVVSLIDKLAKKNIIHKNKASNLKSKLSKQVSNL